MNTIKQQSIYEKDALIRKQAKEIEKLQLEVNALKISLSGSSLNKNNDGNVTPLPMNNDHQNPFWQSERLFNRAS